MATNHSSNSKKRRYNAEAQRKYNQSEKGRSRAGKFQESAAASAARKIRQATRRLTPEWKADARRRRNAIRLEALTAYGGNPPKCSCECGCSESKIVYLDLDHVNNNGADHRRQLTGTRFGGLGFLLALKKAGWPSDTPIRVLCVKCNIGRQRNGGQCPELGVLPMDSARRPVAGPLVKTPAKIVQPTLFDDLPIADV